MYRRRNICRSRCTTKWKPSARQKSSPSSSWWPWWASLCSAPALSRSGLASTHIGSTSELMKRPNSWPRFINLSFYRIPISGHVRKSTTISLPFQVINLTTDNALLHVTEKNLTKRSRTCQLSQKWHLRILGEKDNKPATKSDHAQINSRRTEIE